MKFTVHNTEQKSVEWLSLRAGRLTGSVASDVMATIKSGEAAARKNLRFKLALERLTGCVEEDSIGHLAHIKRGNEKEPVARMRFEGENFVSIIETGFLSCDELMAGASLDGHIGDFEETVELKCPNSATHWQYLTTKKVPSTYLWQVTHGLWITGAEATNFVSFDDRFPAPLDYLHIRVPARDLPIEEYDRAARAFLAEVDDLTNTMKEMIK